MLEHILVPLDGSDVSERALEYARQIVAARGRITLFTALDVPDYPATMFYPAGLASYEVTHEAVQEKVAPHAQQYLEKIAESLRDSGLTVDVDTVVGEPANAIVERAEVLGVDAIVMSTHGRSGINRWLFGSVANKVLSSANCPVFIVPVRKR